VPVIPRVARATAPKQSTRAPDPVPVWIVLRWAMSPAEIVPAHALAWGGEAVLVEWLFDHPAGGRRQDWFSGSDVLMHQPSQEEFRELVNRPRWMSGRATWPTGSAESTGSSGPG
jgi:hypothetical protein